MADAGKKVVVVTMSRASPGRRRIRRESYPDLARKVHHSDADRGTRQHRHRVGRAALAGLLPSITAGASLCAALPLPVAYSSAPPHTPSVGKVSLQQTYQVRDLEDATCSCSRTSER
jgi:hypothetical protein